jgi:hypothetical protein
LSAQPSSGADATNTGQTRERACPEVPGSVVLSSPLSSIDGQPDFVVIYPYYNSRWPVL